MKMLAFFFVLGTFCTSCDGLINPQHSGILSKKEMTDLLVEIHLTEAAFRMPNDSLSRLSDSIYLQSCFAEVFRKQNVKPDRFSQSLNYYVQHIEQLDEIYGEVISRLTEIETSLQEKSPRLKHNQAKDTSATHPPNVKASVDSVSKSGKAKATLLRLKNVKKK